MQKLATQFPNVRLIRINAYHPEIPKQIDGKNGIGLSGDATDVVNILWESIQ